MCLSRGPLLGVPLSAIRNLSEELEDFVMEVPDKGLRSTCIADAGV